METTSNINGNAYLYNPNGLTFPELWKQYMQRKSTMENIPMRNYSRIRNLGAFTNLVPGQRTARIENGGEIYK